MHGDVFSGSAGDRERCCDASTVHCHAGVWYLRFAGARATGRRERRARPNGSGGAGAAVNDRGKARSRCHMDREHFRRKVEERLLSGIRWSAAGIRHLRRPGLSHQLFGGHAVIDGSAAISWSRGTFAQATFELPRFLSEHLSVGAEATREADGTDYRLKNTEYLTYATVKPRSWLTFGGQLGYSQPVSVERPRPANLTPTQDVFTATTAPGLTDRPAFLHSDLSADVDTRNHPSRPTSGGDYRVTLSTFSDRDFGQYSFRRVEAEASRFIPILHENWVIGLRARVASSDTSDGNVVPFYLLPTLGGSRSLRGYDDYRFRDRNLLLFNAEYRWRVFGALDGALFYDAGKVAPRFGDLDLKDLKSSYGLGFRFHSNNTTVFRVDVGRSAEGTRLLLSITDALKAGHGSIFIPYVP
jgi:hypothetical protein